MFSFSNRDCETELQVSGSELSYNPEAWNREPTIRRTNCLAYAFGIMDISKFGVERLALGDISGKRCDLREGIPAVIIALKEDMKRLGRKIKKIGIEEKCPLGMYKIALYAAPSLNSYDGYLPEGALDDIHFYRENPPDKNNRITWSHKRGYKSNVTNVDANGKEILNPELACRDYSKNMIGSDFSILVGIFAISEPSEAIVE